jgi:anti-anti-sigma regulatory factor
MKYTIKKRGKVRVLSFDGPLTLNDAKKIREALLKSLENTDDLRVDLNKVTKVDLSCLQLFCSAHRTVVKSRKHLKVSHPLPKVFETLAREAGFIRHMGCEWNSEDGCLWLRQEA